MNKPTSILPVLSLRNLGYRAGEKQILREVSAEVHQGRVAAITGPSGSGKSTLLRLLNRLSEPSSGTVLLNGQDYKTLSPQILRQRVCLMMQTPHLFPGTVADNLRYGPLQQGIELEENRMLSLLERVELPDYDLRNVAELSGGEAQRVSLARVLANSPEVLLLDEPTSALDENVKQSVEELLCRVIREEGLTCLLVTHDMAQAQRMADEIWFIKEGRIDRILVNADKGADGC